MKPSATPSTLQLEELDEEHSGEEGLLADGSTDKGKLQRPPSEARLVEINSDDRSCGRAQSVLQGLSHLIEDEAAAEQEVKDAQKALDAQGRREIRKLTEEEIKTLVVDDKWLAALAADVQTELDRVSQALTGRIRQLAERYATPLPQLTNEVESLAARVDEHLKKMGAVWN